MTVNPKKILILKFSALGDVCLALPHVEVIVRHHSDDEIWVMTGRRYVDFFRHHPRMHVAVLDRNSLFGNESTIGRIRWVRKMHFDAIYDLQGNRTSRLLSRFCKAPNRVGTQPDAFFTAHPPEPYTGGTRQNIFDRLDETLRAAGLPQAGKHADLHLCESDIKSVLSWKLMNRLQDKPYVLLHAGCSPEWPSKQWPLKHFARLAALMEGIGLTCVWIGGEEDRNINQFLSRQTGMDATGTFSLIQLYGLAKGARFGVTNDSGPMHVLAVSGLPVYSFFGPTDPIRSHAAGQRQRTISRDVFCSPCFLKKCPPKYRHACLELIKPEDVFKRIHSEIHNGYFG